MTHASRLERRRRNTLATYVEPATLALACGVEPERRGAWIAGKDRSGDPRQASLLWDVFAKHIRSRGFVGAGTWITDPKPWARRELPADLIAAVDRDAFAETIGLAIHEVAYDFDHLDSFGGAQVGLAGDWHGNTRWALKKLERFHRDGIRTILHLGDFGLWPTQGGAKFLRRIDEACSEYDQTIFVTDGNHEDHARLASIEPYAGKRWVSDRVAFFERGHRWRWQNQTFVSLGGAASVDFEDRAEGRSWWREEVASQADVDRAVRGGRADVLLTHDAPAPGTPVVEQIIRTNPLGFSKRALEYAAESRVRVTETFHALQPALNIHGHMHYGERRKRHVEGFPHLTETIALSCDNDEGNIAILDVLDLHVRPID